MNIFILLTPFHLQQLEKVAKQYQIDLLNSLFLVSSTITKYEVKKVLKLNEISCLEIPSGDILLKKIIESPFTEIPKNRKYIKTFKAFIKNEIAPLISEKVYLYIGSEKHIFTQVFINYLEKQNTLSILSALDEGLGYYRDRTLTTKFFSFIYPILTPIIFNQKLNYFSQLGIHKSINIVYARFPNEIPNKKSYIKYLKIKPEKLNERFNQNINTHILIFTSPLSEYKLCSKEEEMKVISIVIDYFISKNINYTIKPHPSESIEKYDFVENYKSKILDPKKSGEELDYFKYSHFIHFGSSIVIDLYSKGVSLKNIITINPNLFQSSLMEKLFSEGYNLKFYSDEFSSEFNNVMSEISKAK